MATASFSWTVDNTVSTTGYKLRYRLTGTSEWTEAFTSGTTASVHLTDNYLYDLQVVNLNTDLNNPASPIVQAIGIGDPSPVISPVNTSVNYTFNNLSDDIDTYTATIAPLSSPGIILATHILSPADTITDTFTGLSPITSYLITITPAANEWYRAYTYITTTTQYATCANVSNITATLS